MNLCFVGYGAIAAVHADIGRRLGHRLHTVVGRVPEPTEAFAREYGFARHTLNLEEALAQHDVDAVVICSPSELHESQARQTIEAGKHVLVELPLAMSYGAGAALAELSRLRGVTVMVAHTQRYMSAVRMVRDEIAAGRLHLHHILARRRERFAEGAGAILARRVGGKERRGPGMPRGTRRGCGVPISLPLSSCQRSLDAPG